MALDIEFQKLKQRWLKEKNYEGERIAVGETTLGGSIISSVNRVLREMNNKEHESTAEELCETMEVGDRRLTPEEKKVCNFVLRNLLKIKDIRGNECAGKNIDAELKEYVYCTAVNLWSTLYRMQHCDKKNGVEKAYSIMKGISEGVSEQIKCNVCEYGKLEPMMIRGRVNMLDYIYGPMTANNTIMTLINKDSKPTPKCEDEKDALTKLGLQHNSGTMNTGSKGSSRDQHLKSRQGQGSAAGDKLLSELIQRWIVKKDEWDEDRVHKGIWIDIGKIFDNMIPTFNQEEEIIREWCSEYMGEGENVTWDQSEKEFCKAVLKIILYTNGLTQNSAVRESVKTEDTVETYFRCIVGWVVLVQLYGGHCLFNKVIPYLSEMVEGLVQVNGEEMTDHICYNFDLKKSAIGGKVLWGTIKKWVDEKKKTEVGEGGIKKHEWIMTNLNCPSESTGSKGKMEHNSKGGSHGPEWKDKNIFEEFQKIMKEENYLSQAGANQVMEKMNPNHSEEEMKKKLESEIQVKVQEEKKAAAAVAKAAVAATVKSPQPVTHPCYSSQSEEETAKRRANEQKGDQLRDAWEKKKEEFTKNGTPDQDEMKEKMDHEVNRLLGELKNYMNMREQRTNIPQICGDLKHEKEKDKTNQMKRVCKRLVRVIYWMEGWDRVKKNWKEKNGKVDEWQQYLKCVIGNTVILRIFKDKCEAEPIMEVIAQTMEGKAKNFPPKKYAGMECSWIRKMDIKNGEKLIDEKVEGWLKIARSKNNGVSELDQVMIWMTCKTGEKKSEGKNEKKNCRSDRIMDLMNWGRSKELGDLVNTDQPATKPSTAGTTNGVNKASKSATASNITTTKEECESIGENDTPDRIAACLDVLNGQNSPDKSDDNDVLTNVSWTGLRGQIDLELPEKEKPVLYIYEDINDLGEAFGGGVPGGPAGTQSAGGGGGGGPNSNSVYHVSPQPPSHKSNDGSPGAEGPTSTTPPTTTTGVSSPTAIPLSNPIDPSKLLSPYLPTIPVAIATSVISYLLWKYFAVPIRRRRYRRAHPTLGPTLQEQIMDYGMNQDGPHEYTLVKERKPRSTSIKRRKKRVPGRRRAGRGGVRRRMIIDIHLEVLDECQKGDLHSTKEDFFEILVQEFMGSEFMKEDFVSMENVSKEEVPKEQVPCSDSGFREGRPLFVRKMLLRNRFQGHVAGFRV
ncbi:SICA-like antigen [Plasmodium coatneyi]|uniref:SICA-like antigen n=1 Tax=Plasmodium coatneyi TaxID=208452 RepID=A0A1B1E6N8_9APIC|nr:SICA-like antigen [Plasmodium coatneyi]ANQ10429.1 SICA-like antigen [Plasmodium coatneyi]